jgi:hypothetical protein
MSGTPTAVVPYDPWNAATAGGSNVGVFSTYTYGTIAATLAAAESAGGGFVLIGPGTWNETITVTSDDIKIIGAGRNVTIVNGTVSGASTVLTVGAEQDDFATRLQVTANAGSTAQTRTVRVKRGATTAHVGGMGTISVTNGLSTFTGVGLTVTIGQIIQIGTVQAIVASNTGGTSGTFTSAWSGATVAGSAYDVVTRDLVFPDAGVSVTGVTSVSRKVFADLTGTVTLTSGSAALTGAGTAFDTELVSGDMIRTLNGYEATISGAPASATSATLSANWTGPTQTGIVVKRKRTTSYAATTDYLVTGGSIQASTTVRERGINNFLSWSPAGSEPAAGEIYDVTFTYIPPGAQSVTLASTTGLSVGDFVLVTSTIEQWDWSRPDYVKGEIARIDAINTGTGVVTFRQPLHDAYLANTTYVVKPNITRGCKVAGLSLVGNATPTFYGLNSFWTEGLVIEDIAVSGVGVRGISVFDGINTKISHCDVLDAYTASGGDYGIYAASVDGLLIDRVRVDAGHHGVDISQATFTIGATRYGSFISRNVTLRDSYIGNDKDAGSLEGVHTHLCDDLLVTGNTIYGGVGLAAIRSATVRENIIHESGSSSAYDLISGSFITSAVFENNTIYYTGTADSVIRLRMDEEPYSRIWENVWVTNNTIVTKPAGAHVITLGSSAMTATGSNFGLGSLIIKNNRTPSTTSVTSAYFLLSFLDYAVRAREVEIDGNRTDLAISLRVGNADKVTVNKHNTRRVPGDGYTPKAIGITSSGSNYEGGTVTISDCNVTGFDANAVLLQAGIGTDVRLLNNYFDGCGTSDAQVRAIWSSTASTGGAVNFNLTARGNTFTNTVGQTAIQQAIRLAVTSPAKITGSISENTFNHPTAKVTCSSATSTYLEVFGNVDLSRGYGNGTKTANYTCDVADDTIVFDVTSGNRVVTLPLAQNVGTSKRLAIVRTDASGNTLTIAVAGADAITGSTAVTQGVTMLVSDGISKWIR